MSIYRTEARLKPETPFSDLFPEGSIPVRSILSTTTDQGEFYIVNDKQLIPNQLKGLAQMLLNNGQGVPTLEDAIAYIQGEGLPIRTSCFSGVGTNNPGLFFSLMDGPEEYCDCPQPDDFDDDDDFDD